MESPLGVGGWRQRWGKTGVGSPSALSPRKTKQQWAHQCRRHIPVTESAAMSVLSLSFLPCTLFPSPPHLHPPFLSFLSAVSLQDSSQGITYLLMSTTAVRREKFSFRLPWRFQLVFWHGWRVTSVGWKPRVQVKMGSCFHHRFFCIYYSYLIFLATFHSNSEVNSSRLVSAAVFIDSRVWTFEGSGCSEGSDTYEGNRWRWIKVWRLCHQVIMLVWCQEKTSPRTADPFVRDLAENTSVKSDCFKIFIWWDIQVRQVSERERRIQAYIVNGVAATLCIANHLNQDFFLFPRSCCHGVVSKLDHVGTSAHSHQSLRGKVLSFPTD